MSGPVDTWMPWYIGDYLKDTTSLTTELHGAYLLLLATAWVSEGKLPDDDEELMGITKLPADRWRKARPKLQRFFHVEGGFWTQKRLTEEYERALRLQDTRSKSGTTAANARWKTEKQKPVDPTNPWSLGKMMLKQSGMKFDQTGRFIGKLIRENGEAAVLEALKTAQAHPPADLKGYLLGILKSKTKAKGFTNDLKRLAQQSAAASGEAVPGIADDLREQDAKVVGGR